VKKKIIKVGTLRLADLLVRKRMCRPTKIQKSIKVYNRKVKHKNNNKEGV